MKRRKIHLLLPIVLVALTGCFEREVGEGSRFVVEQEWPAEAVREIAVDGVNGTIEILPTETDNIRLVARVRTRGYDISSPDEVLKRKLSGGILEIEEKHDKKGFVLGFLERSLRIDYELRVPDGVRLDLNSVNGRVSVDGVAAPVEVTTVNGRVEVNLRRGELEARTVNGRIEAAFSEEFRGAKLKTVNGAVRVSVPSNASLYADISQVNGSFHSELPVSVRSSGRRSTEGAVNGGEWPLSVTTVNGSVRLLELPPGKPTLPDAVRPAVGERPVPPEPPAPPEAPAPL